MPPPAVSDAVVQETLRKALDMPGMRVTTLTVTLGGVVRPNTRLVELRLLTPNAEAANQVINQVIHVLGETIDSLNKSGAQIALTRMLMIDASGSALVYDAQNVEAAEESWSVDARITSYWWPHPTDADLNANVAALLACSAQIAFAFSAGFAVKVESQPA